MHRITFAVGLLILASLITPAVIVSGWLLAIIMICVYVGTIAYALHVLSDEIQ